VEGLDVRDVADDLPRGLAGLAELRHERSQMREMWTFALPVAVSKRSSERGDDVRVGVRAEDGAELLWRDVVRHREVELAATLP
jgi:hypothetical protein